MSPKQIFAILFCASAAVAAEADALRISANIQARHMPFRVVMSPIFAAPDSDEIVGYTRCGDSAIWTGHYLAAESFRYAVTRSPEALVNVRLAIDGIRQLIDVTGNGVLARCLVPVESPYATGITQEEASHGSRMGIVDGRGYFWIGDTSRDQYSGVFFGLGVAYDVVDDPSVKGSVRRLVERLLDFLIDHAWAVVMPGGDISTVFWGRADQQLSFLQVGRRVDSGNFGFAYQSSAFFSSLAVITPVSLETLDPHNSYFKFNLDVINLYNLIRLEGNGFYKRSYKAAYDILRRTIDDHQNAHFNMIDRALNGPNAARDAQTRAMLDEWLTRPTRDFRVDLRGVYPSCEEDNRACSVIPVGQRVTTDFLWQRSPFQLYGGGDGFIEGAGIDYILPYWMARYYGVL